MDWLYRHRKADWTGYSGTRMLVEDSGLLYWDRGDWFQWLYWDRVDWLHWDGGSGYNRTEWTGCYGTVMLIGLVIVEQEC